MRLFAPDADYLAFLRALADTVETNPIRILAFCIMSNHWHFVLWREHNRQLRRSRRN